MAARLMHRERPNHTWQPTGLVHEAYAKLIDAAGKAPNRRYFFGAAAEAMRQVLVDHARRKIAEKRGGRFGRVPLDDVLDYIESAARADILALNDALDRLQERFPHQHEALHRQFFGGQPIAAIAEDMQVSVSTVNKYLRFAKAFLHDDLHESR
jgi:RNA polymerase sigma factor (TIGR02999 family)